MNWKLAYETAPKSFELFVNHFFPTDDFDEDDIISFKEFMEEQECNLNESDYFASIYYRELYDFFDEQGIYVIITPFLVEHDEMGYKPQSWFYEIFTTKFEFEETDIPTRPEAETASFLKAFEILNHSLNKIKK